VDNSEVSHFEAANIHSFFCPHFQAVKASEGALHVSLPAYTLSSAPASRLQQLGLLQSLLCLEVSQFGLAKQLFVLIYTCLTPDLHLPCT
jgi:hypothetical protein